MGGWHAKVNPEQVRKELVDSLRTAIQTNIAQPKTAARRSKRKA